MTRPNTSNASISLITRLARQARGYSVPLLAAGALAAGCGTVAANPGGPNQPVTGTNASASPAGPAAGSASGSAPGSAPPASAKPVPTVSGGSDILVGGSSCAGWPADAAHGTLTAMFTPVAVERCVNGLKQIPGKGEWMTATLERSTDKLATLSAVLMQPPGRQPDVMCPEFVVLPPQIVLFSSTGKTLIPKLPVGACGTVAAQLLSTLGSMTWQPISVRLVSKVDSVVAPKTFPGASIGPGSIKASPAADSPKALRTGAVSGVENGSPVH
jgi:hypothetical protein